MYICVRDVEKTSTGTGGSSVMIQCDWVDGMSLAMERHRNQNLSNTCLYMLHWDFAEVERFKYFWNAWIIFVLLLSFAMSFSLMECSSE